MPLAESRTSLRSGASSILRPSADTTGVSRSSRYRHVGDRATWRHHGAVGARHRYGRHYPGRFYGGPYFGVGLGFGSPFVSVGYGYWGGYPYYGSLYAWDPYFWGPAGYSSVYLGIGYGYGYGYVSPYRYRAWPYGRITRVRYATVWADPWYGWYGDTWYGDPWYDTPYRVEEHHYYHDAPAATAEVPASVEVAPEDALPVTEDAPTAPALGRERFLAGIELLGEGNAAEAALAFDDADRASGGDRLAKLFVGLSLFGTGDYELSADRLESALHGWPLFPDLAWDLRGLWPSPAEFDARLRALEDHVGGSPQDLAAQLVRLVVLTAIGEHQAAAPSLAVLRASIARGPVEEITAAYQGALARRRDGASVDAATLGEADPRLGYLASMSADRLPLLGDR